MHHILPEMPVDWLQVTTNKRKNDERDSRNPRKKSECHDDDDDDDIRFWKSVSEMVLVFLWEMDSLTHTYDLFGPADMVEWLTMMLT